MPRWPRKTTAAASAPTTVSWTSDTGETVELPPGVTPGDDAAGTVNGLTAGAPNGEDAEQTAEDRIAEMLLRGREHENSRVKVEEITSGGKLAYCKQYTPDEFEQGGTLDLIRKEFGPGRYRIQIYSTDKKTGRFDSYRRADVEIKALRTPEPVDVIGARLDDLKNALTAGPASAGQPKSQIDQLKEMMSLAVLFREAFGFNSKPAPQPSMASQLGELINIMKGAREIAAQVDPPPEQADPLMAIAQQALPIIGKAIEGQQRPAVLAPVTLPPTLANAPAANPPQEVDAVNNDEFTALREAIRGINTLAIMDANVELAANLIYDKLPDEAFPLLESPDWFARLTQVEPSCAKHQAWYTQVRDLVVKFWNEPDDGDESAPAAEPRAA